MSTKLSIADALTLDHPSVHDRQYEEMTVTPALAEKWLGLNHQNRNQRKAAIASYARDMSDGNWLFTGEAIKFDWDGVLIDGQHRLEAIIQSGASVVTLVIRGLDPRVRGVLDVNVKRSGADALKFDGKDAYTYLIASVARISHMWDIGIFKSSASSQGMAVTNSEVIDWYAANRDIDDVVHLGMSAAKRIKATPSTCVFAVLLTYRVNADDAFEFWTSIANLTTDGAGDPRLALADAFQRIESQRLGKRHALQLSLFFRAWNAWRKQPRKRVTRLPIFGTKNDLGVPTGLAIPEPK